MASDRRFPPPWRMQEHRESFVVQDRTGQPLAYVYFEDQPQRAMSMHRMDKSDAYKIARAIMRLPSLLRRD
jgi:hypothetical protein